VVKLPVADNVFVTANRYAVAAVSLTVVFNSDFYENQEYLRNGGDGIKRSINLAIVEILSLSVALTMGNSTFNT